MTCIKGVSHSGRLGEPGKRQADLVNNTHCRKPQAWLGVAQVYLKIVGGLFP